MGCACFRGDEPADADERCGAVLNDWMERWPDAAALAGAAKSDVITAWGRLGTLGVRCDCRNALV